MDVKYKRFSELHIMEYHRILALRVAVFVVEQECPYQEVDDVDLEAIHLWLEDEGEILAYARIYQSKEMLHFGRVLVKETARHQKLGSRLVQEVLDWMTERYPNQLVEIGAQAHLQNFYGSFGFEIISEVYLEDNIPHIDMKKKLC